MLDKDLKKIVKEVFRKDLQEEALTILEHASKFRQYDIRRYYNEKKLNIVCIHLDLIKEELVFYKILEQKETDGFGKSLFFTE